MDYDLINWVKAQGGAPWVRSILEALRGLMEGGGVPTNAPPEQLAAAVLGDERIGTACGPQDEPGQLTPDPSVASVATQNQGSDTPADPKPEPKEPISSGTPEPPASPPPRTPRPGQAPRQRSQAEYDEALRDIGL